MKKNETCENCIYWMHEGELIEGKALCLNMRHDQHWTRPFETCQYFKDRHHEYKTFKKLLQSNVRRVA